MFELHFLGTSAAAPSVYRGLTAQLLIVNEYRFLIDCGEGTQRQILQSGLGFKRLNRILLTHSHLDHILGLGGLVSTLTRWENLDRIDIWGGKSTLYRVNSLLFNVVMLGQRPPIPIELHTIEPGLILDDKNFTVTAFPVKHQGVENYGYLFQEKSRRPFLNDKAEMLGVPFGPERAKLVAGERITLKDGRVVTPDEVLGETIPGVKYVHVGDCGFTGNLLEVAENADCLVIEATYLNEERELARQFGHLTATDGAQLAKEAGVKTLILTHISRRSRESDILNEAQAIFPNTFVARDFDHFLIHRDKPVEKVKRQ
ncbi:MAG: ribonuclease Z [Anaerolineae bacterium]|nr:MAG: ribonuclease Z [Anaerolineae bacterium]